MDKNKILDAIAASPELQVLVAEGNHQAIADILSLNSTERRLTELTERGIRAELGDVEGARFMRVIKTLSVEASLDSVPQWLSNILAYIGRPQDTHVLTLDTMGIAASWLQKSPGLDIGSQATWDLLDIIAMGNPEVAKSCQIIKNLSVYPLKVTHEEVTAAIREGN